MNCPRRQPPMARPDWQEGHDMSTFVAAYAAVWLAVVLYVARLGAEQRRLARSVESLQLRLEQREDEQRPPSMAA